MHKCTGLLTHQEATAGGIGWSGHLQNALLIGTTFLHTWTLHLFNEVKNTWYENDNGFYRQLRRLTLGCMYDLSQWHDSSKKYMYIYIYIYSTSTWLKFPPPPKTFHQIYRSSWVTYRLVCSIWKILFLLIPWKPQTQVVLRFCSCGGGHPPPQKLLPTYCL